MTVDKKMESIQKNKPIRERGKTSKQGEQRSQEKTSFGDGYDDPNISQTMRRDPFPHMSKNKNDQ